MNEPAQPPPGQPAIILCEPQLGENVGTAARAMANFGLRDLRLVNPREGWPNDRARAAASGADHVIDAVRVYPSLKEAIADLRFVYATTRREREIGKPVAGPREAAAQMRASAAAGRPSGVIFGRERTGLTNDDISYADEILTLPVDPDFGSLNVAQAVLIVAYEWRIAGIADEAAALPFRSPGDGPAPRAELIRLFEQIEGALEAVNFFRPPEKRPHVVESIRSMLQKAALTEQEVRTLRGVVAALERRPTRPRKLRDGTITTERGKFD
ncbi:MAG TPA: RNA methyltransferase [Bauldia sp.]|nr:RNA methyltransferase [Bauldia sp.]